MAADTSALPDGLEELDRAASELPGWITRGAVMRMVGLLSVLLLLPLALPWNETLTVPLTIVTASPPRSVRAAQSAVLVRLNVAPDQRVEQGAILAQFGTGEEIAEADALDRSAQAVLADLRAGRAPEALAAAALGGDIQAAYGDLARAIADITAARVEVDRGEIEVLRREIADLEGQAARATGDTAVTQSLVTVAEEQLGRKEAGAQRGWVSKDSVAAARGTMFERRLAAREARNRAGEARDRLATLRARLRTTQLTQGRSGELGRERAIQAAVATLAALRRWRADHVAVAPIAGRVKFPSETAPGQWIERGAEIAVVVPERDDLRAIGTVPGSARGDVTAGMDVQLTFPGYPVSTYGHVPGRIARTSDVAVGGGYEITVALPDRLVTTAGYPIPARNRGTASGRVLVRQGRLGGVVLGSLLDGLDLR